MNKEQISSKSILGNIISGVGGPHGPPGSGV